MYTKDANQIKNPVDWNKRASGMRLWYATEKGRTCAVVKSTKKLQEEGNWKDLKNVSELFIEDEDGVIRNIPPYITGLRHLRILSIRWARFKSLNIDLFPLPITHLCLSHNHLHNVNGLEEMSSLMVLNITNNDITSLPYNIGNLRALRELDVSGNKITKIPESIGALRHLRVLNLSSNKITFLPNSLCDLDKVRVLEVSMNTLNSLPDRIGNMKHLTELYASDNKINSFPPSLQSCSELRYIHMRKNRLVEVPKMMQHLPYLQVMNFRQNNLVDFRCPISSLKSLLLDTNDFKEIPDAVFKCHNLELLSMEDNLLKEVPNAIQELRRLRTLYLSYNEIDELPSQLCSLDQLKHLVMHGNKMSFLPLDFYCLHNLSVLNLEGMDLEPDIMQAYREGVPSLTEHIRKRAHGDTVTLDPKNVLPDKEYTGAKTAILIRNSTMRSSAESTEVKPSIRGRYAVATTAGSNPPSRENTDKRKSTDRKSTDDKEGRMSFYDSNENIIPISRSRPGTAERSPEEHPGHIGHFEERTSVKRGSSAKKKGSKKKERKE